MTRGERIAHACTAADFEARYATTPDPWNFGGSDYERRRYAVTLAALRREHYGRAYEPGCSIGEFTALLAPRCAALYASDFAPSAVARARTRCLALAHVDVGCADVASELPPGTFDLIVFAELGYYFTSEVLARIAAALAGRLNSGGEFLAVHWLGASADHRLHGDEVHAVLRSSLGLAWLHGERHPGFRLDTWGRTSVSAGESR